MDFADTTLAIIVGITTGVLSSTLVWWLLAHQFRPKIEICPEVARFVGVSGRPRCQTRIVNRGKRPLLDVRVVGRVVLNDLFYEGNREWITVVEAQLPKWDPAGHRRYSVHSRRLQEIGRVVLRRALTAEDAARLDSEDDPVRLDELLALGNGSEFHLTVTAIDSFSGATGVAHQAFTGAEIIDGRWSVDPDTRCTIDSAAVVEYFSPTGAGVEAADD